jgi:DNA-directed RNA polymerase subunit RPC12/RpoP
LPGISISSKFKDITTRRFTGLAKARRSTSRRYYKSNICLNSMTRKDFSEVGHTGGKATFKVVCDKNGHVTYQIGYSHSSSFPASVVGIYAHPDGFACGNIKMGGMGQPWNTPPFPNCIPVMMASDSQGKFGHECPECNKHFRTDNIPAAFPLTCPYCGFRADSYHYLTPPQNIYIQHYVNQLMQSCENISIDSDTEIVIDMNLVADATTSKPRPDFYYTSTTQQTEFECSKCNCYNDIRGRYGYCASCGSRNTADLLKVTLEDVREQLVTKNLSPFDAVKKAVSEFDSAARDFSNQFVSRVPMKEARINRLSQLLFHNLDKFDEIMNKFFGINLLKGMDRDRSFLRKMFCRRHVYEHDGGVVTNRYLSESGDQETGEGTLIRETEENVHNLIGCLKKMIQTFDNDFHEIFEPEQFCIKVEEEKKERMKKGNA